MCCCFFLALLICFFLCLAAFIVCLFLCYFFFLLCFIVYIISLFVLLLLSLFYNEPFIILNIYQNTFKSIVKHRHDSFEWERMPVFYANLLKHVKSSWISQSQISDALLSCTRNAALVQVHYHNSDKGL